MKLIDGVEWNPISFTEQLIPPILRDEKLETRRIIRGAPHTLMDASAPICEDGFAEIEYEPNRFLRFNCPYGKAGVRLWVRERFACYRGGGDPCKIDDAEYAIMRDGFRTHRDKSFVDIQGSAKGFEYAPQPFWRPPMHCPFWASRISLEVVSIGIERLQQITEAGAIAEGFRYRLHNGEPVPPIEMNWDGTGLSARDQFIAKWDQINGKRIDKTSGKPMTWDLNCWVWVVKFKRIKS